MIFSYYPGCTLRTKAKELDNYARDAASFLGITLEEIKEWQCCGAVYPLSKDEIATRLSSIRTLNSAKEEKRDLITICSACHHVIKRVNNDMQTNADIREKANNYLKLDEKYAGETKVLHYLEMLRDVVGFDEIKKRVVKPLTGRKIAAYYGCLLLRPSDVMDFDDSENPTIMEDFIRSLGADAVDHPYKNECCGGYISLPNPEMSRKKCHDIIGSAIENGADEIITACPLCMYNLDSNNKEEVKITYFTELLCEALGLKEGGDVREDGQ